jgi:ferredoxin
VPGAGGSQSTASTTHGEQRVARSSISPASSPSLDCTDPGEVRLRLDGHRAGRGADLTLTELASNGGHHFLVNAASEAGSVLVERIEHRDAREDDVGTARELVEAAAGRMGRVMPRWPAVANSAQWADVAERCLTCGSCTMVCPTSFCTTTEDVTDLTGDHPER